MGYVCAFRGRRDSYQVPLALAECGKLDRFLTDHYLGPFERLLSNALPKRLAAIVQSRYAEGLSADRIKRLRVLAASEIGAKSLGLSSASVYDLFDRGYGKAAAREAGRHKSDLIMYSSYAHEAFTSSFSYSPRKVLLQYHPHYSIETNILNLDRKLSQQWGIEFRGGLENVSTDEGISRRRGDSVWRIADHVICASSFTKQSLTNIGADPSRISVIPYGVELSYFPKKYESRQAAGKFHALFVGSGLQRKGLHHLLLAWQRARLPSGARLTVVARVMDKGLLPLLHATQGVHVIRGVTEFELVDLYRSASVFVMPSLVEGFGQVFLEALSQGLPVVGTSHTCLPDLGGENDGIFLIDPGNVDELVAMLERLSTLLEGNLSIRINAADNVRKFTWTRFRSSLGILI